MTDGKAAGPQRGVAALFTLTLFASAFLMFLVQPMFAKMALPRLGGSAAVWSLALVFFQAVLLLGYGYAHLMVRWLGLPATVIVHVLVCLLALASLPVAIAAGYEEPPDSGQALWLIGLFAASVGVPFFALSANAPLLQAWFARAGQARSGDPYFLYAASNAGSFAALIAYPFVVEPFLALAPQRQGWSLGFFALSLLIAACGLVALRARGDAGPDGQAAAEVAPVGWGQRLVWIGLSLLPAGLLVSETAFIATDLVSAPFLWVIPLALYLLTFVIAFQSRPWIPHRLVMSRLGLWGTVLAIGAVAPFQGILLLPLLLALGFLLMLACHGELARRRPPAARLTEFYFFLSLGGVLGGMFSALAAPLLFDRVLEYPLLVIASLAALGLAWHGRKALDARLAAALVALPLMLLLFRGYIAWPGTMGTTMLLGWTGMLMAWLFLARNSPVAASLLVVAIMLSHEAATGRREVLQRSRSFYGVLTVEETPDGRFRQLVHGTTTHGLQRIREKDGTPVTGKAEPRAYYFAAGPFGSAIRHLRAAHAADGGRLGDVALVGLGVGAMLCFSEPGERWHFYEIDPHVVTIASDPRFFTLLRDCGPAAGITIGDGRLKLGHVAPESQDLIVLDAFSSDSVPAHLLTREALQLYMSKLKPGGIAVFHTSNRFLELNGVVEGAARDLGLEAWHTGLRGADWPHDYEKGDVVPTLVVVAKPGGSVAGGFDSDPAWQRAAPQGPAAWTDDYSNVPAAIWRQLRPPGG